MNTPISDIQEVAYLSDLFVRSPPAFSSVEARLFGLALSILTHESQQLTFQFAFNDVIPGDNADGKQYAKLLVAIKRLMQATKDKTLRQEKGCSQYLLLFSTLSLKPDTEVVTGKFNPDLKEYLLDLSSKYTTSQLEVLLMRR